jgi:secondary thiamine-phosphate synthase enzyme
MPTSLFVCEEQRSHVRVCADLVQLRTEDRIQFVDLTEILRERVRRSGVAYGLASVQSRHTTTAIVVNEDEPMLLDDMGRTLERLVPAEVGYEHDDLSRRSPGLPSNERRNGDSHCRSMLLGASETLHVVDGALQLGRWQRIFLVELDGPQARSVSILVMGAGNEDPE